MSTRGGRGRGGGSVKPTDRTSSSSRDSSLTRSTPSTPATIEDDHHLLRHYTAKTGATASVTPNLSGTTRTPAKFTPNLAASKKDKDKTNTTPANIPTATNSNNDQSSRNKKDFPNGNRSQQSRGAHHNQRGGHLRGNFVQMEGIFQGNAQIPVSSTSSSSGSRFSSVKSESSASSIRMPNVKKLGTAKTVLIGDVDGLKYEIDEEYEQRRIPLAERRSVFDIKKEPSATQKLQQESSSSTDAEHINSFINLFSQQQLESTTPKSLVKDEPMEQTELPKTTESIPPDQSQLILMQFPDVLPCIRASSSTATKPELASLSDLPDGFLGKLQIYKSGKCRLKLSDDTYLNVDIGQPASFLQNVMVTEMASTTNTLNDSTTNDMNKLVCLGDIKHKLIVSLDVDHVLQDTRQ